MTKPALICAAVVAAAFLVPPALAASPKKGGVYKGTLSGSIQKRAIVAVDRSGKKLRFSWYCGTGRAPTVVGGIPIDSSGRFKYTKRLPGVLIWKIAGHFTSPTQAFVSLNAGTSCAGSSGKGTLTLQ